MRRAAGFSLLELMCALLILGIGLVGLTQGITTALRSGKESEWQTTAALIAAGQIESLRAEGYILEGVTAGEFTGGLALYRWRQTVTRTPIDGLFEVEVAVENSRSGELIYALRTMLFDPPLLSTEDDSAGRNQRTRRPEGGRR